MCISRFVFFFVILVVAVVFGEGKGALVQSKRELLDERRRVQSGRGNRGQKPIIPAGRDTFFRPVPADHFLMILNGRRQAPPI